jgi:hypothetical protein
MKLRLGIGSFGVALMLVLPQCLLGTDAPVSFTLSAERATYSATQTILVHYVIKNISNHALYVPRGQWTVVCPSRPLIWASFQNAAGKDFRGGYAGSCSPTVVPLAERMAKEAVLLLPSSLTEGTIDIDPAALSLKPGEYRIKVVLYGWTGADFPAEQRAQVARMRSPLLHRDVAVSVPVTLTK